MQQKTIEALKKERSDMVDTLSLNRISVVETQLDYVELKLIEIISNAFEHGEIEGNRNWTRKIFEVVGDLGHELGYDVCAGGFRDRFECQWLYDLVWYQNDDNNRLVSIPLVLESEWKMPLKEIKVDFEKLLQANATHRLMICQARKQDKDGLYNYFSEAIKSYQSGRPGDRFLIIVVDNDSSEFENKLIIK